MMKGLLASSVGLLRIVAFFEGISLLILVFIAVPLKYFFDSPGLTKLVGPVHGVLFLLFVVMAIGVAFQQRWGFTSRIWKVLLASLIPFGTFYVDKTILSRLGPDADN